MYQVELLLKVLTQITAAAAAGCWAWSALFGIDPVAPLMVRHQQGCNPVSRIGGIPNDASPRSSRTMTLRLPKTSLSMCCILYVVNDRSNDRVQYPASLHARSGSDCNANDFGLMYPQNVTTPMTMQMMLTI